VLEWLLLYPTAEYSYLSSYLLEYCNSYVVVVQVIVAVDRVAILVHVATGAALLANSRGMD
jgi:hypothetical protein